MPKLKLTYFDIHGGRGEAARLAMYIGGVEFEDNRLSFPQFSGARATFPFYRVPMLEVDGVEVSQCNAINRYVGKLTGLYPTDPVQALFCDEVMDAVEDIVSKVSSTFGIRDEEQLKLVRKRLAEGPMSLYLSQLGNILESRGGEYFADHRLTVADLRVMVWVRSLRTGTLDHVPPELPDTLAPRLVEHLQRVESHPKVVEYYDAAS